MNIYMEMTEEMSEIYFFLQNMKKISRKWKKWKFYQKILKPSHFELCEEIPVNKEICEIFPKSVFKYEGI